MSYAHRHIANASALLRRGQHLRHPVTVARTSAIPRGQASCSWWRFNAHPQSKGFLRSYALRVNQKPAKIDGVDPTTDDKESVVREADNAHTSHTAERGCEELNLPNEEQSIQALKAMMSQTPPAELDLSRQPPWKKALSYVPPDPEGPDPEVRFDQSEPAPQLTWTQDITYQGEGGFLTT